MLVREFTVELNKLKEAFTERQFPEVREKSLWQKYQHHDGKDFTRAVDHVILNMPQPSMIISMLDDQLRSAGPALHEVGADAQNPPVPNSAQLAQKYMPSIRRVLQNGIGLPLPYDPKKRQA